MSFELTLGPLVQADSIRQTAFRFGGGEKSGGAENAVANAVANAAEKAAGKATEKAAEKAAGKATEKAAGRVPPEKLETDRLLAQMIEKPERPRTLDRFVEKEALDWEALNRSRLEALQRTDGWSMRSDGVLILDDVPLPKPHARKMDYLSPIYDTCEKRKTNGYLAVHLYYHHRSRPSYSLGLRPWLKTSQAEGPLPTTTEKSGRRRARPGEEKSRLDLGVEMIEEVRRNGWPFEAVVMDSWYTARWLLWELSKQGISYVGEASSPRKLAVEEASGEEMSLDRIWARFGESMPRRDREALGHSPQEAVERERRIGPLRARGLKGTIPRDRYTKVDQPVKIVLVEGLHEPREKDGGRHVLVSNRLDWSVEKILRLFSERPTVEAVHRRGKQQEGWLCFRTEGLQGLRCHLALCLLRGTLLRLLRAWSEAAAAYSLRELIEHWIRAVAVMRQVGPNRWEVHLSRDHPAWPLLKAPRRSPPVHASFTQGD